MARLPEPSTGVTAMRVQTPAMYVYVEDDCLYTRERIGEWGIGGIGEGRM